MNTNTAPTSAWIRLGELQEAIALRARWSPNPVGPHGSFTLTSPGCQRFGVRSVWGIEVVLVDPNAPTVQVWTGRTLDAVIDAAEAALESYLNDDLPDEEEEDDEEARERSIESLFPQPLPGYDAGRSL